MTQADREYLSFHNFLLIIPLAFAAGLYRFPDGWRHWAIIVIIPVCLVQRERISYNYWTRKIKESVKP